MQLYTLSQWDHSADTAQKQWSHPCTLESKPGEITLREGLELIVDTLGQNPHTSRWISVGAEYKGRHSLKGFKRSNALALEYVKDSEDALIAALERLDIVAYVMGSTDEKNPNKKRRTVVIPMDDYVDFSSDFTNVVSWVVEDLAVEGFVRGEACTFFFYVDPTVEVRAIEGSELLSVDYNLNRTGFKVLKKWKAAR